MTCKTAGGSLAESEARLRVLLIDDDDTSREVLELLLGQEQHEVAAFSGGAAAVATVREGSFRPELVLTDLQMPGLSGAELARELRAVCQPGVRVIVMSGSEPGEETIAPFDAFLAKPFSMEAFATAAAGTDNTGAEATDELAGEDATESEVMDETVFGNLAAMMRPSQLEELFGLCLHDADKQRAAMEAAIAARDEDAFRRAAHAMKGSFGMLGARELQEICSRLETSGMIRDAYAPSLANLVSAMARLRGMLRARGVAVAD
jgi:CheY-like chemotaxis protein